MRAIRLLLLCTAIAIGAAASCAQSGGANLLEGAVDACALLAESDVQRVVGPGSLRVDKGTLQETWGSACRWSRSGGDPFVSVVAHTKNGAQTFNGLRRHLPDVRDRRDLAPQAYQSGNKIYLLTRGALVTLEWSASDASAVDDLVRTILANLDEVARTQAVTR